jgi:hypothetical protein
MTLETELTGPKTRAAKPAPATTRFIFIGDPNDNGAASRAKPSDDDAGDFVGAKLYGIAFPKGKAVEVRLDRTCGPEVSTLVVTKLRGNPHFFEGTEDELKAAKAAGEVVIKPAPKKVPVRTRDIGVRGLKQPEGAKPAAADDGDDD